MKSAEEVIKTEDEKTLIVLEEKEEVAQNSEERAMNHVNSDTSLESRERVEVDTSIVDQAYPIEAKKVVDAGHERAIAVLSTQQEVATDTRESLEKNTEEMNSVQESNRKPIESASSETMVRAAYRPANLTEQTQYFEGLRSLEDDNRQEHRHSRHNRRNNERNDKNDNNKGRRGSGRGNNNKNDNSKVHQDAICPIHGGHTIKE